ncbi:triose-phosphate transporter family-domain-containing protein [Multifurca ochricompacta]|uniref:Triose-phosphate transporter family-domain-containing protein n=1 Tax=Multifurca ochricompacta TaxID=376703 RepID=A0AAD4LYW9_9AGAM|nr:triose-phosphate transporter family-domain-containing protein [Multifurca ochricompacta]
MPVSEHVHDSIHMTIEESQRRDNELHDVHFATIEEKKRLWFRDAFINTLFIASWFVFAIILSLYNKWMFAPEHFGFPLPLFVTMLHMFVQTVLASILRFGWPRRFRPEYDPSREDYVKKAIPVAVSTGLDIGLSNLSLKTITLSFYTMCKSSSLVFVLAFAFFFRLETFSFRLIAVILLISAGVLLMVATETHFVLGGFILVLSASALGGLRWSLTQLLMGDKRSGMNHPAATVFCWGELWGSRFLDGPAATLRTVGLLIFPGVIAFSMVLSEYYIIQRVGAVPMSIAGMAKEVATISVSALLFGDELTPLNITGVAVTVCGIGLFTHHKYRKRLESDIPLDPHGQPLDPEDEGGLGPGSIALREGYGPTQVGHADGGTTALEPLLPTSEGIQSENHVLYDSDVDHSDDDSDK